MGVWVLGGTVRVYGTRFACDTRAIAVSIAAFTWLPLMCVPCNAKDIDANEKAALALYDKGTLLCRQNKNAEAIQQLKKAAALNPNHSNTFMNLGRAHYKLGQWPEAAKAYNRAGAVDPKRCEAPYAEGLAFYRMGNIKKEEECYRRAIRVDAECWDAWNNLIVRLCARKMYRQALVEIKKAYTWHPPSSVVASLYELQEKCKQRLNESTKPSNESSKESNKNSTTSKKSTP